MLLCERHAHCVVRLCRVLGSAEWAGLCAALVQVDALPAFVAQSAHTQTHYSCQIPHPCSVRKPSHSKALKPLRGETHFLKQHCISTNAVLLPMFPSRLRWQMVQSASPRGSREPCFLKSHLR